LLKGVECVSPIHVIVSFMAIKCGYFVPPGGGRISVPVSEAVVVVSTNTDDSFAEDVLIKSPPVRIINEIRKRHR